MEEVKKNMGTWSSVTPGLLILLQDGSDKSFELCNKIIDKFICCHFDGTKPKNRCFIIILNLQGEVCCSGWLAELNDAPLDIQKKKIMVPDGCGGTVEVEVNFPIWIKSSIHDSILNAVNILNKLDLLINDWCNDFETRSTFYNSPMLLDIGCKLHSITETIRNKAFVFGVDIHKLSSQMNFPYDQPTSIMRRNLKANGHTFDDGIFQTEEEVLSCFY